MTTRAFRTLDCAQKVRIRFYLPRELDLELVRELPGRIDEVTEFSRFAPGARDHVRFSSGEAWSASAALGEALLVATFGKFGGGHEEEEIEDFKRALCAAGLGPVVEVSAARS